MSRKSHWYLFVMAVLWLLGCSRNEGASTASAQAVADAPWAKPAPTASKPVPAPAAPRADLVARGRELVNLGGCGDCHTPKQFDPKLGMPVPDMQRMFSGHPEGGPDPVGQPGQGDSGLIGPTFTSFKLPFGVVYTANLTPDRETGLGSWSAEEFIATMRTGHDRGKGRAVLPPMPWQNLASQPEQDLRAMFAYLQSIPAVKNRVPAPKVPPAVIEGIGKSNDATASAQASR
jgi:hypothetical protein